MARDIPALRILEAGEVDALVDWAANEGWNPGLDDAAAFRAADAEGFLGAFVRGEMVAGIAAVAYGDASGFMGLYICRPDMRGRGFGRAVWDAGMARLAGRTVGLDGVPEQQANYRSMGFDPLYRTVRFSGRFAGTGSAEGTRRLLPDDFDHVAAFDRRFFPAPRGEFLARWLSAPHAAMVRLRNGKVCGYGVARRCREGFKVGPLFALDHHVATALMAALADGCDGVVHVDVPDRQEAFSALLDANGFVAGFETARMYRGPAPAVALDGIFGITSLELG
ncbi:MAG: GNAT family N-acetyltransferase [Rhizobiaceae bacterium]|nr:GNAT family N-acetyltransferase [Rhizobiaceae bacterium]